MQPVEPPGSSPQRTGSQSVDRALAILTDIVAAGAPGRTLTEVAAALGLSASTAHRLLRALVRAGYVDQDPVSERYRLGRMSVVLGRAADESMGLDRAQRVIDELARRTGETASVGVLDGTEVVILLAATAAQTLRVERDAGARVPAHASAIGKVLLAHGGLDVAALSGPLERFTATTLTDPLDLAAQFERVRDEGVAVNLDERHEGVSAVAAPVFAGGRNVRAAVGVQLPTIRLTPQRRDEITRHVVETAAELSGVLPLERL